MHVEYDPMPEPTGAEWERQADEADQRIDRERQQVLDDFAERYQKLGRMAALTELLNELRTYGYPLDFCRVVAAKLARESGVELPA